MTPERVLAVLEKYENVLKDLGRASYRADPENVKPTWYARLSHIRWMCEETKKHIADGKMEKAMRWLGFIQGVLWSDNVFTIAEMKDDNR